MGSRVWRQVPSPTSRKFREGKAEAPDNELQARVSVENRSTGGMCTGMRGPVRENLQAFLKGKLYSTFVRTGKQYSA